MSDEPVLLNYWLPMWPVEWEELRDIAAEYFPAANKSAMLDQPLAFGVLAETMHTDSKISSPRKVRAVIEQYRDEALRQDKQEVNNRQDYVDDRATKVLQSEYYTEYRDRILNKGVFYTHGQAVCVPVGPEQQDPVQQPRRSRRGQRLGSRQLRSDGRVR
jgi:hypothetical protein